jgi:serine protease Do
MKPALFRANAFALLFILAAAAPAAAAADLPALGGSSESAPLVAMPSFAPVVEKAEAAVVNISTTKVVKGRVRGRFGLPDGPQGRGDLFDRFFGDQGPSDDGGHKEHSMGTGFIIDSAGYIITNNHVVEGADTIKVKLSSGEEIDAEIIGRDPKTDLGLIKLKKAGTYPFLALGDSRKVKIGDWVVAIGNPFGFDHTVTSGILSARNRRGIGGVPGRYEDYLQTDAAINLGNSGGPLLNLAGEVIGINTAIISSGSGGITGISFAIPTDLAKGVVAQLKEKGRVVRGWMGVVIQKVTPDLARSYGLGEPRGALIGDIDPEGPAVAARIQRGDIILKFDGQNIADWQDLPLIVANTAVGKKVKILIWRDSKEATLDLTVAEFREDPADSGPGGATGAGALGLTIREITPEMANRLNLAERNGLYIAELESDSPAAESGLQAGDVLLEVDNREVKTQADYQKAVGAKKKGDILRFLIRRGGNTMFFTVATP